MALNEGTQFWPDSNGLEWKNLVLAWLEWLEMEDVSFGLTIIAWNG
jgi:hypothetical protein